MGCAKRDCLSVETEVGIHLEIDEHRKGERALACSLRAIGNKGGTTIVKRCTAIVYL